MLPVFHTLQYFFLSSLVVFQLIGDDDSGGKAGYFEQFSEKLLCSRFIPSALHEDIEHHTMLVNGPPQVELLPLNCDEHLIEMPLITRLWPLLTDLIGIALGKFETPWEGLKRPI